MLAHDGPQLLERRGRLFVLGDPAPHANHVSQCPVGDALAVGEATAAMPVRDLGKPVHVLEELPREPRLAYTGDPDDRHEMRRAFVDGAVEELLHQTQFAVAADERRLEPFGFQRPASARDDA